jgi:heme exporter protein D
VTPEALSTGKYAAYIWPAYAVSALGFAWMILDTLTRARRWKRKADGLEDEAER